MDSRFRGNDRTFERAGDLANRGQELPLVRIGSKSFAHEDAIGRIPREEPQSPNTRDSALLAGWLEGQGDQVAEPTWRQGVLIGKETVVGVQAAGGDDIALYVVAFTDLDDGGRP